MESTGGDDTWRMHRMNLNLYILHMFECNFLLDTACIILGPVVQSIVSLTSSLVVKMLTVLVSTISNSQIFF